MSNSTPRHHNKKQRAKARALALSYRLIECMLSRLLMLGPICLTAPLRLFVWPASPGRDISLVQDISLQPHYQSEFFRFDRGIIFCRSLSKTPFRRSCSKKPFRFFKLNPTIYIVNPNLISLGKQHRNRSWCTSFRD